MGLKDTLNNWRAHFVDEKSKQVDLERMLEKCGIWGCLLGGVLTSKIAQYIYK